MADYLGEKKKKNPLGTYFFIAILGMFLIVYLFGNSLRQEGIPVQGATLAFWVVFAIGIWIMAFMVSRLSAHEREMDVGDWVIVLIAGGTVIAYMILFRNTIPVEFKGSLMAVMSLVG